MEDISPHLREPVDDRFDTAVTMHVEAAAGALFRSRLVNGMRSSPSQPVSVTRTAPSHGHSQPRSALAVRNPSNFRPSG